MASVSIWDLGQRAGQILERVRAGETITIADRGAPFAEIRPLSGERSVLARLAAEGRLIPATLDPAVLRTLPKGAPDEIIVADRLAADREQERS